MHSGKFLRTFLKNIAHGEAFRKNNISSHEVEGCPDNCSRRVDCACEHVWKQRAECVEATASCIVAATLLQRDRHLEKGHYYRSRAASIRKLTGHTRRPMPALPRELSSTPNGRTSHKCSSERLNNLQGKDQ